MTLDNKGFAKLTGYHFTMASRIRNGMRRPSYDQMKHISEVFDLDLAEALAAWEQGAGPFAAFMHEQVFQHDWEVAV